MDLALTTSRVDIRVSLPTLRQRDLSSRLFSREETNVNRSKQDQSQLLDSGYRLLRNIP